MKAKRVYEVVDNSGENGNSVNLTVWGADSATNNWVVGDVIAMKSVKVSMWGGHTISTGFDTQVFLNSDIQSPKAEDVKEFYKRNKADLSKVVQLSEQKDVGDQSKRTMPHKVIQEIEDCVENDLAYAESKVYFINGFISYIKSDDNTVYMACPGCKKKVQKDGDDYRCEKCNTSTN
jgi:replication factor A1